MIISLVLMGLFLLVLATLSLLIIFKLSSKTNQTIQAVGEVVSQTLYGRTAPPMAPLGTQTPELPIELWDTPDCVQGEVESTLSRERMDEMEEMFANVALTEEHLPSPPSPPINEP